MPRLKADAKHYRVEQMSLPGMRPVMRAFVRPSKEFPRALVLDPFAGAGTTAVASFLLGCDFVGGDVCPFAEVGTPSLRSNPRHTLYDTLLCLHVIYYMTCCYHFCTSYTI